MMDDWGWRGNVAGWLHRLAYRFYKEEEHDLIVRDSNGEEVFSVALSGGFVASGPPEPYTLHCRHYKDGDDEEGHVIDLS